MEKIELEQRAAEQIITETTDKAHLANAERWAQSCGFRNLRTLEHHTGDKPDFTRIINQI